MNRIRHVKKILRKYKKLRRYDTHLKLTIHFLLVSLHPPDSGRKSWFFPQLGGSRQNIAIYYNVWYGRTRMVWLPDGETFWKHDYRYSLHNTIHESDRQTPRHAVLVTQYNTWKWQTDRQTPASCGNKPLVFHGVTSWQIVQSWDGKCAQLSSTCKDQ